jgi:hypothetical protein
MVPNARTWGSEGGAERCGLELHHREPYARGGPPTEDNLELRCRAHNALAAEEDFGRRYMDFMRNKEPAANSALDEARSATRP